MKFYNVKQLDEFKIKDKHIIIALALTNLSPIDKVVLRLCKLLALLPLFLSLSYYQGWLLLPILLIAGTLYPIITRPIELAFAKKHLSKAILEYKKSDDA